MLSKQYILSPHRTVWAADSPKCPPCPSCLPREMTYTIYRGWTYKADLCEVGWEFHWSPTSDRPVFIWLIILYSNTDREQHRDQSEWTVAWDSHKLQVPRLSYNWWGFQAWDTLQESTDDSSIDKVETSLEWQEYFSQLQDMTDALPSHIHHPVYLWFIGPHSRAAKKNTNHGNEVLPQDTTHLIHRPCYQRGRSSRQLNHTKTSWRS